MTDFRALCEELIQQLQELHTMVWGEAPHLLDEDSGGSAYLDLDIEDVLDRARAALAEQPVGATDEELWDFALQNGGGYFNCDCQEEADILTRKHVSNYRAVLARFGQPAATPIPVADRLPGRELCWWFEPDHDDGYGSQWSLLRILGCPSPYTHWLPANALPVPAND
jgi:hypothetical protein